MSTKIVELGLSKVLQIWAAGPDGPVGQYIERLLGAIAEGAVPGAESKSGDFAEALTDGRERLFRAMDPADFRKEGRAVVTLCEKQFANLRKHFAEREAGLGEIVAVLTRAMGDVTGESAAFNANVLGESERMNRLTQIEDIQELKKQVSDRVGALRQAVVEKQKKDEESQAKLSREVETLKTRLIEARTEAAIDQLTGIANRRTFDRTLARWIRVRLDGGNSFALGMIDIDNFKKINDQHGHQTGDRVLLCLAQRLNEGLRRTDLVARYGGEEFGVLLSDITLAQAENRLSVLVKQIANALFEYEVGGEKHHLQFTVTCGVTEFGQGDTADDLVKRADGALYDGKQAGKNRVVVRKRSVLGGIFDRRGRS